MQTFHSLGVLKCSAGVLTTQKRLSTFAKPDSKLRLIVATSAFGLGVDIPDIQRVIHWGIPSDVEEYVQESGRAGRNGELAQAIIYSGKGGKHSNKQNMYRTLPFVGAGFKFL